VKGYLVGDRIVPDDTRVDPDPSQIINHSERVYLIDPGLERFVRISAGRASDNGPLIYSSLEMPLGPEKDVESAYLDRKETVKGISGVTPGLDASFRLETFQRKEVERRREELQRIRLEEEEKQRKEQRVREISEKLGDGEKRREMAKLDFDQAARAALAVGGAEYLDHTRGFYPNERVVKFLLHERRFECVCDASTLRIIDGGICLGHGSTRTDDYFTLESLPGVIRDAIKTGVLHVTRRVDRNYDFDDFDDFEEDD
jgi:hypothetical protein